MKPIIFEGFFDKERIPILAKYLFKHNLIAKNDLLLFTAGVIERGSTNFIEIHKASDILKRYKEV
jgi:hypothetical protein